MRYLRGMAGTKVIEHYPHGYGGRTERKALSRMMVSWYHATETGVRRGSVG